MKQPLLTKWRVLISDMTIFFPEFWPKNTQMRHFLLKIRSFFYLREALCELNFTSFKVKSLTNLSKCYCYNRILCFP